jgi:Glutathione-dependent formaldehyde-activating enzyme
MEIKGGCLLRRGALHSRGRPDERNGVPLPGLPEIHCSVFAVLVRVPKEAVTIEGTLKTFTSIGGSGNPILRHFCPECGSSIAEESAMQPDSIVLNVGTLTQLGQLARGRI